MAPGLRQRHHEDPVFRMPQVISLRPDVVFSAWRPRYSPEHGTVRCAVCGHHWFPLAGADLDAIRADMLGRGCGWCVSHLSASQLEAFALCPRKWGLARLDKIEEPESTALKDGSAYHAVAERYLATGKIDHSAKYGEWLSAAVKHLPTPPIAVDRIEQWFCFEVPSMRATTDLAAGIIGFRGRVDLWLPSLILDHKTCSDFKWAKTSSDLATGFQSVLYAHAHLRDKAPGDSISLRWVYVRKRGAAASVAVDATLTREQAADVFRRVHLPLAKAITLAREAHKDGTITTGNDLTPNPRACSAFGGCYYAATGDCKLTSNERVKALMSRGNDTMANADELLNDIEDLLNAAPKGRIAKPKAATINRPKPAAAEPEPAASIAEAVTTVAEAAADDDDDAELERLIAAKKAAKAAKARAAEEALAAAKARAAEEAAAAAKAAQAAEPEPATVEPFDAIDSSCWIAVVAQSGDVALADSTVAALRLRRGV